MRRGIHVIKEISTEDLPQIIELHEQFARKEFPLPSPFVKLSEAVAKNSMGEIVAYGILEVFAEALLVLDKKKPLVEKSEAISALILASKAKARELGIPAVYIFARDPAWAEELKKHFGFQKCDGEALVMRI